MAALVAAVAEDVAPGVQGVAGGDGAEMRVPRVVGDRRQVVDIAVQHHRQRRREGADRRVVVLQDVGDQGAAAYRALARIPLVAPVRMPADRRGERSEEHTSELQSLMRISYAVFCLKKKKQNKI